MVYRVRLTARARRDADLLYERVTAAAPYRGPLWFERLLMHIRSLSRLPHRSPVARENEDPDNPVRQLLFGKRPHVYRVLYQVVGAEVVVLRTVHGAQSDVSLE